MDLETASSTMLQENGSIGSQVNNNTFTLFEKNLRRVSDNIDSVNDYYTPKYDILDQIIENQLNPDITDTINEEINNPINFVKQFHKITMNEIESRRKTQVQSMLDKKINAWKQRRCNCSRILPITIEASKRVARELQEINLENLNKKLENSIEYFQSEYTVEKILEQKKINIKFKLVLNKACNLLNDIKKLLNESQISPQLLSNQKKSYMLFENGINKFKDTPTVPDEQSTLALCEIVHKIEYFHDQLMIYCHKSEEPKNEFHNFTFKVDKKPEVKSAESFTFKLDDKPEVKSIESFTFKLDDKPEVKSTESFKFKPDDNPEVKSAEFFTFKFKTDEKVEDSIVTNSSFKKHEEIKNNNSYNCKDEYKLLLNNFQAIQKYLTESEKSYSSFLLDENQKSLKRELIKAVYTPVNSISSTSPWHMKDKFDKLDALLKCKTVETGNSKVSANSHQNALSFCKHTLAKKIVNFGENVADVKKRAAFEVASIATELWQVHPNFGLILYATFKQKCPCLIPYNAIQTNKQTDEEYYKSLGYSYTNGVVEKQDKYVKRMTGIIRLFVAILVTETKSGKALGIEQAWMLIAATLNLAPQLDVTAILLHELLITTGYDLKKAYGRQFTKLLKYIDTYYMKKIDEVTPITCAGPVQRFKTFITKALEVGCIEKPKDIISKNFW